MNTTEKTTTTIEQPEPQEDPQEPQEQPQDGQQEPDDPQGQDDEQHASKPHREAARYRRELREAQAELAQLREQRDAMTGQEVDRQLEVPIEVTPDRTKNHAVDLDTLEARPVKVQLRHPGDLYTVGGVNRADLLDDKGSPDQTKIATAVATLHRKRPDLFVEPGNGAIPGIGDQPENAVAPTGWDNVVKGR